MVSRMLADCLDECMTFSIELRHASREMMKLLITFRGSADHFACLSCSSGGFISPVKVHINSGISV